MREQETITQCACDGCENDAKVGGYCRECSEEINDERPAMSNFGAFLFDMCKAMNRVQAEAYRAKL